MIIYKITNIINGKVYIGQTTQNMLSRFASHKSRSRNRRGHKSALHNAIKKHGEDNFKIEEIDGANNITELNYREDLHINLQDSMVPNGYNLKKGGRNSRHSQETKKRQSDIMKLNYNKQALDDARILSIEKMRKEVIFENSKTGEIIEYKSIKESSIMGNRNYIADLLNGRRPYGLYKGFWIYYKSDTDFMKKRNNVKKIELYVKIRVKHTILRNIQYFNSKKEAYESLNISKYILDKHLDTGLPVNNYIIERDL